MSRPGDGPLRGCLVVLALYTGAAVTVLAVWMLRPTGTGSSSPEPVPSPSTSSSSYTPAPGPSFTPEIDLVLSRAWSAGRYGCGITGPAVDGLAAALERDIGEAPPLDARIVAAQWVNERCRR